MYKKIHITQIANKIWKQKLLIFLITIVFSLLAYFSSLSLTRKYSTEMLINNPPFYLFDAYTHEITKTNTEYLNQLLSFEINKNLLDIIYLEKFIDQNTELNSFKIFLKSRNISVEEYFKKNKIQIKKDLNNNNYIISINHTHDLEGRIFLKSYVNYIKDNSITQFKKTLKILIDNRVNEITNLLVFPEDKEDTEFINSISKKKNEYILAQLSALNKKLDDDRFDYKISFSINSNQQIVDNDKESIKYILMGLIFGLFLSLTFIFLRN